MLRPGWGLDDFGDRLPGATLRGYAASLAPGWIVPPLRGDLCPCSRSYSCSLPFERSSSPQGCSGRTNQRPSLKPQYPFSRPGFVSVCAPVSSGRGRKSVASFDRKRLESGCSRRKRLPEGRSVELRRDVYGPFRDRCERLTARCAHLRSRLVAPSQTPPVVTPRVPVVMPPFAWITTGSFRCTPSACHGAATHTPCGKRLRGPRAASWGSTSILSLEVTVNDRGTGRSEPLELAAILFELSWTGTTCHGRTPVKAWTRNKPTLSAYQSRQLWPWWTLTLGPARPRCR